MTTLEVDEQTVRLGMALGLMRYDEQAKVYELTPKGAEWLRDYCARKLAEHGAP